MMLFAIAIGGLPSQLPAQPAPGVPGVAYRINPGDELEVLVWGDERLQRSVRVLPDGTFAFPLVGQVIAAGRLPVELERIIASGLQSQYRGQVPQVTVSVKNPSGFQFSVIGKVKGPGTFTPGRYVNALEALSIGGGPTEFADLGNIRIIRKVGNSLQVVPVRIGNALKGNSAQLSAAENPQIFSGDTLVVP
jgi:polysaccharide export outer membrane protein